MTSVLTCGSIREVYVSLQCLSSVGELVLEEKVPLHACGCEDVGSCGPPTEFGCVAHVGPRAWGLAADCTSFTLADCKQEVVG